MPQPHNLPAPASAPRVADPQSPTERDRERLAWTRAALHSPTAVPLRASVDAGFRSYWRAALDDGRTRIVMDSPPGLEDVRPWLRVHALLDAGGVRVPRVLAEDADRGFLLLEDLGGPTLAQVLDAANADVHFDAAIEQLLRLQAIPLPADTAVFGEALLQRDAGLFDDWFVQRHLRLDLDADERTTLLNTQRLLADNALAQARVATHRDFMPRNLMPVADGPAVLDFQDLVAGPIAYDAASLFKDAFLSWPLARVDTWLARYHARAVAAGLPVPARADTFLRDAEWLGVQRHLKILGIFARLHHRDGKPRYLIDAPRFIAYLDEVLPRHRELDGLAALIATRIKPAMQRIAAA